ncbi:hypothetical protein KFK09_014115 [Dendrobium nobile]|uniref:Uncharacterized protein n=1 Tax=Dendrobium nobile TaxID=94219 RepID=A0A8T3BAT4_DENNO|nr:hypothetical protein KFK09_014115 [Dendrobium nobile]
MLSTTIPTSSSSLHSSASRERHQFYNKPAVVDDYLPLELPLRWRNPPPDHLVRNQHTAVVHDSPLLQLHFVTHGYAYAFSCALTPLLRAQPEPIGPLPSLTQPHSLSHDLTLPLPPPSITSARRRHQIKLLRLHRQPHLNQPQPFPRSSPILPSPPLRPRV